MDIGTTIRMMKDNGTYKKRLSCRDVNGDRLFVGDIVMCDRLRHIVLSEDRAEEKQRVRLQLQRENGTQRYTKYVDYYVAVAEKLKPNPRMIDVEKVEDNDDRISDFIDCLRDYIDAAIVAKTTEPSEFFGYEKENNLRLEMRYLLSQ